MHETNEVHGNVAAWHHGREPTNHGHTRRPTQQNVLGPFYVDSTCIDCGLCRELAASIFRLDDETGFSYVHRQPGTADELAAAREAMEACPTESIGCDGEAVAASDSDKARLVG